MMFRRTVLLAASLALTLSACGGSDDEKKKSDPASKGESSTIVEVSPLTGQPYANGAPANPVLVTKIENTRAGAPQYGVNQADLVVEELVEGGLTRLAAMFHTTLPNRVGHVRSLRGTDASIASPVGGHIVASGGAGQAYGVLDGAGVPIHSEDRGAAGFSSDPGKSRPYNRLVDLAALASGLGPAEIPGPYFDFTKPVKEGAAAPAAPAGARPVTSAAVRFSPGQTTNWAFDGTAWTRANGLAAPGEEFAATTVVVVFAPVVSAGYRDPAGNDVPETRFEGGGRGMILSGGTAIDVTWAKDGRAGKLTFTDAAGAPVTITPGKTWIELVPDNGSVTAQ